MLNGVPVSGATIPAMVRHSPPLKCPLFVPGPSMVLHQWTRHGIHRQTLRGHLSHNKAYTRSIVPFRSLGDASGGTRMARESVPILMKRWVFHVATVSPAHFHPFSNPFLWHINYNTGNGMELCGRFICTEPVYKHRGQSEGFQRRMFRIFEQQGSVSVSTRKSSSIRRPTC